MIYLFESELQRWRLIYASDCLLGFAFHPVPCTHLLEADSFVPSYRAWDNSWRFIIERYSWIPDKRNLEDDLHIPLQPQTPNGRWEYLPSVASFSRAWSLLPDTFISRHITHANMSKPSYMNRIQSGVHPSRLNQALITIANNNSNTVVPCELSTLLFDKGLWNVRGTVNLFEIGT